MRAAIDVQDVTRDRRCVAQVQDRIRDVLDRRRPAVLCSLRKSRQIPCLRPGPGVLGLFKTRANFADGKIAASPGHSWKWFGVRGSVHQPAPAEPGRGITDDGLAVAEAGDPEVERGQPAELPLALVDQAP